MTGPLQKKEHSSPDKVRSHMTETILNLTLEIIYLLTGEDYILVKTFGQLVTPSNRPCVVEGWSRIQKPITEPPPISLTPESNDNKILEVTQKITELLTGEVPIRCQDVTVYFSMEEWEYLEGHKDLYKDFMMEKRPPLTSPDGSRNRNTPERCPRPLYSRDYTQEHQEIPQTHSLYSQDSTGEHHETPQEHHEFPQAPPRYFKDSAQQHHEIPQIHPLCSQESTEEHHEIPQTHPLYFQEFTDKHPKIPQAHQFYSWNSTQEHKQIHQTRPIYYQDSIREHHEIPPDDYSLTKDYQDENLIIIKVEDDKRNDELGQEEEISPGIRIDEHDLRYKHAVLTPEGDVDEDINVEENRIDLSTDFQPTLHRPDLLFKPDGYHSAFIGGSNLISQQRAHNGKKRYSCSECGKCFAQKSGLGRHERNHRGSYDYTCSHCGKSFTQKAYLVVHERIHTNEKPFSCSVCGKCFNQKPNLLIHERIHSDVKPYTCSACGKCFRYKSSFTLHERLHTGDKPFSCPMCGKRFSKKSSLVSHERRHIGQKPLL